MSIVITGSVAYDYIMSFPGKFREHILPDQIAHLSVSFLVDSMHKARGGCAPNIAYSMSLLHQHPIIMATVGQDAEDYRRWLEHHGVDTRGWKVIPDEFTASFFVSTDEENNQIASFYTGAMAKAKELSFRDLDFGQIEYAVISPNDPEAMRRYVKECQELQIPYVYDPSQQIVRLSSDDLLNGVKGARVFVSNEYEYEMVKAKTGLAHGQITSLAETVIVTEGENGSTIYREGKAIHIPPAPPQAIVDPTGVGDAYRGGLLAGLHSGLDWDVAGRIGSLAATYVLENMGTQSYYFTLEEFIQRYRTVYGDDKVKGLLQSPQK